MKTAEHSDSTTPSRRWAAWLADGVSAFGLAALAWSALLSMASGPNYIALIGAAFTGACIGSACMVVGLKYGTACINGIRRVLLAVGLLMALSLLLSLASMVYGQ